MKKLLPILLLLATGAGAYYYFRQPVADPNRIRISGNLEITEVTVAFKQPGRIVELPVREGDNVRAGQLLARLDAATMEFQKSRDVAGVTVAESALTQLQTDILRQRETIDREATVRRAEIAQAEAQLRDLEAGSRSQEIAQAQAALDDARAQFEQAKADWERAQRLFAKEDISRVAYDQAQARFRSLSAVVQSAEQRVSLTREGPRKESIELAKAQLARARAALQLTEANRREIQRKEQEQTLRMADITRAKAQVSMVSSQLDDSVILSPLSGVVLTKPGEIGEIVAAGATVMTLGDLARPWLRGYIMESQLGRVKLGQPVKLSTDSYPGRVYDGKITFIASEAEFTPKQIQTAEERVKLVYRIKVEVANPNGELKNNMPIDAEIVLQ